MCQDCGCTQIGSIEIDGKNADALPQRESLVRSHSHSEHPSERSQPPSSDRDPHLHSHIPHPTPRTLSIHQGILSKNDRLAERNREFFQAKDLLVLNLLSSPGSGKTSLIEQMAKDFADARPPDWTSPMRLGVIVGDLATDNDSQRLRQAGPTAVQITTGNACHLEAEMVARSLTQLNTDELDLLMIENVGNLVCPAGYDLGEALRVVVLSTTEGEDKPLKYPTIFKTADIVLINKIDVAAAVGCDLARAIANVQQVAPQAKVFKVSARTGAGMMSWYADLIGSMFAKPVSKQEQPERV